MVYVFIGVNDFAYYGDGADIYNGALAGQALTNKINGVVADIETAVDAVIAADNNLPIILSTVGDPNFVLYRPGPFSDPAKRQLVSDAVNQANVLLLAMAAQRPQIVILDANETFGNQIFMLADPNGNLQVAGETISLTSAGDEPHHGILSDNIHAGTVIEGLIANQILPYINAALNRAIPPFSDHELLAHAGIAVPTPLPASEVAALEALYNGTGGAELAEPQRLAARPGPLQLVWRDLWRRSCD